MKITQEQLNKIVEAHGKWWRDEEGGKRADLSYADLSGANLSYADLSGADLKRANLSYADLSGADLKRANLSYADLSYADLSGADLKRANLSYADLSYADLSYADLNGANLSYADLSYADLKRANLSYADLDKTYYQVVRIGSRNATTTFCVEDDNVTCGCWNNYKGGTLAEFKERVESVYGENGKTPNKKYHAQYMAAIEFFEKMAELAKER